ncbi:Rieske 2Fe-2S domain-containing protein [Solitalea sp. MAHUQ-68]|uniref:Rieske 2Fe-2S domain-containing protein n=1 Tax=Solitalea agri TaxID=2953739 RepID=A0A9X2F4B3_9SPHI|nr:Rieske 2Fe-2S domain-containing protein [Solitalea agri]MCO4291543.1 Rieske 2Fe-2S domain-containing protein [Solitalea agri]
MAKKWFKVDAVEWIKSDKEQNYSVGLSRVNGQKICIVQNNNELYAFDHKCPHAGGHLSQGWLEENMLICPVHRHKYDLRTGRGAGMQGDCVRTYEIKQINEDIMIKLKLSTLNPMNWFK